MIELCIITIICILCTILTQKEEENEFINNNSALNQYADKGTICKIPKSNNINQDNVNSKCKTESKSKCKKKS